MDKKINNQFCKATLTLEQYLNSCPIFSSKLTGTRMETLTSIGMGGRGIHYALAFLKNNWEDNGFIEYVKHPQQIFADSSRLPAIETTDIIKESLPKFFHGLWITNKDTPKKINYNIENFLIQAKKLVGYQTVIWTNIDPDILIEMNPILLTEKVTVRNIIELRTDYNHKLIDFILSPEEHLNSYNKHYYNGAIIDITKNLILESQGGVLADLNFKFDKNFKQESLESKDFIAISRGFNLIENGFMVAKAHHLIFKEFLNIIDEMLNNPECSLKMLRDVATHDTPVEFFSMMPLAMAYMKYNNLEGNNDALINGCSKGGTYQPSIEEIQQHEAMIHNFESTNFDEFTEYATSYLQLLAGGRTNFNCIEDPIGWDSMEQSWRPAI